MTIHTLKIVRRIPLYAGLILAACASSQAATVFLNQNPTAVSGGSTVGSAQLRASAGDWDVGLSSGTNFNATNSVRNDIATLFTLPMRTFSFSLQYVAGEGFIFNVRDSLTGVTTRQAWGTFSSPPGGQVVATLAGRSPLVPFDALQIEARATTARASTTFSNLLFTSADLNTSGSFYSGDLNNRTVIGDNAQGTAVQELLADTNLSEHSWQLSGDVTFMRSIVGGSANDVSLTLTVANVGSGNAVPAPEPSGVLLLAGFASLALNRRRRHA